VSLSFQQLLNDAALFHGAADDNLARVYAQIPRAGLPDQASLAGTIRGPFCDFAETLPNTVRFADKGPGATLLSEALLTDPCFWNTELPFWYDVELRLLAGNQELASARRILGLRRLGLSGRNLLWDAKRFVVRAVTTTPAIPDLATFRDTVTAAIVTNPTEDLCLAASQQGVLLIVDLSASADWLTAAQTYARWPAVGIIVTPDVEPPTQLPRALMNTVLARIDHRQIPTTVTSPRSARFVELDSAAMPGTNALPGEVVPNVAVLVRRQLTALGSIASARAACDRLQADLADLGDFAGYCV